MTEAWRGNPCASARDQRLAERLFAAMEGALPETGDVHLEPTLFVSPGALRIGLRAGEDRLYVVRHIPHFLQAFSAGEPVTFGKGFTLHPRWSRFDEGERALLSVLLEYCEALPVVTGAEARLLLLKPMTAKRVLAALRGLRFRVAREGVAFAQNGIPSERLPLAFSLSGTQRSLKLACEQPADITPLTDDCEYALLGNRLVHVPARQRGALRATLPDERGEQTVVSFSPADTARVVSELLPFLSGAGDVRIAPELEKRMVRLPLVCKVYLDKEGASVIARTAFCYGEYQLDPFAPDGEHSPLLLRDADGERAVLDELASAGFHVRRGKVYLAGQEAVYNFLKSGAQRLSQMATVLMSNDFKRMAPRRPRLSGALRMTSGQLSLVFSDDGTPIEELTPLMEAIRERRAYFRFKNGNFLELSGLEQFAPLAEAVCEAGDARDLGAYRAAYLSALIASGDLPVQKDEQTERAARMEITPCEPPVKGLRPYQLRGFQWLCALRELSMGGVLADDMGLGKTVQMISAIAYFVKTERERVPSLIVAPTSLVYNWRAEIARFAPSLTTLLLTGGQPEREKQMALLRGGNAPDIVLTSYPLIRRDIELLCDIPFRFAVLDEAQQVKNTQSIGAHAVKRLTARTRVALTGTPMENNAAELWSLFDYVLPGYLPKLPAFMRRYGDGQNAADLQMRIRPFLMRRLKGDVLGELPDKLESVLMADMPPEQRMVYQAALLQKRDRLDEILKDKGLARGRAEVLAAITLLRQICCHPALCLPDYKGASGKLEMLMDLLPSALASGRRVLLFSQFTSMLKIIRRRLEAENIPYLYLDGGTPAHERLALCDRFNAGGENVFLISLKAGGTGLNLTGADMVIHYDPWWNPTAEEQAIDRAHRIGQTRDVHVLRLLMHDSIEEQVSLLGKRKQKLFDKLITPGESMPDKLTESDIRKLFEQPV